MYSYLYIFRARRVLLRDNIPYIKNGFFQATAINTSTTAILFSWLYRDKCAYFCFAYGSSVASINRDDRFHLMPDLIAVNPNGAYASK